jgi:hypothetical protein
MKTLRFFALLFGLCLAIPAGNVGNGSTTCPASGSKRISSISLRSITFTVQAPNGSGGTTANMGTITLGGSGVTSTTAVSLGAGDAYTFPAAASTAQYDLTQIYFACSNSADSIVYTYLQ